MDSVIRDVTHEDLDAVLALNNAAVPHVNNLEFKELDRFRDVAAYFRVAVDRNSVHGTLVAFRPGADYTSENFLWFQDQFTDFIYIDRIVVSPTFSGKGIAKALYGDLEATMTGRVAAMTCEVNIRPPNLASSEMHRKLGFVEVGQQETGGGEKRVSLLRRPL
jgi:uncharacterized protein